jgi:hypothetical protein
MRFIGKIWWQICGIVLCWIIFQIAATGRYFGAFVNRFHPCVQDWSTSFPCYGIYDVIVMGLAIILGVTFCGILIFKVVRFFGRSKVNL